MSDTSADAAPDLDLLSTVEADMNRVEESLRRLEDPDVDAAAELAWLSEPTGATDGAAVTSAPATLTADPGDDADRGTTPD